MNKHIIFCLSVISLILSVIFMFQCSSIDDVTPFNSDESVPSIEVEANSVEKAGSCTPAFSISMALGTLYSGSLTC